MDFATMEVERIVHWAGLLLPPLLTKGHHNMYSMNLKFKLNKIEKIETILGF